MARRSRNVRDASCRDFPPPAKRRGGVGGGGPTCSTNAKRRNRTPALPRAQASRHIPRSPSAMLWRHLRRIAPAHSHFRRQATIGPYFVDFACHALRLIIELDGGQHNVSNDARRRRTESLNSRGYRVLRFWNNECSATSRCAAADPQPRCANAPHPRPLPATLRVGGGANPRRGFPPPSASGGDRQLESRGSRGHDPPRTTTSPARCSSLRHRGVRAVPATCRSARSSSPGAGMMPKLLLG